MKLTLLVLSLVEVTVLAGAGVIKAHNHENVLASTNLRGGGGRKDNAFDNTVTSSQGRSMEEGDDGNNDTVEISNRRQAEGKLLPTWESCTLSNQCETGCCASRYSTDGKLKCTPLEGAFRPDICVTHHSPTAVRTSSVKSVSTGTCGGGSRGDGRCADGTCCSEFGWCGITPEHCGTRGGGNSGASTSSITPHSTGTCGGGNRGDGICADGTCCSEFGWCGITPEHCAASGEGSDSGSTSNTAPPSTGTCGGGHRGNGICADGTCCSQYGWCGVTPQHCAASNGESDGTPPVTATWTVTSPAITLTAAHIQVGITAKGDNVFVPQKMVDIINKVTKDLSLYQQLAFVAHTIWESGSYQYREELDTSKYGLYQDCDWNQEGVQPPTNDKLFYGRGFLQLSWCANYKAYGAARMYQGDPDLFYNQPELVATDDFIAMDSAIWFFETRVTDTTGQFGLTTKAINGQIECSGGSSDQAKKRYEIFVALANAVDMSGYSESGCYN